MKREQLISTAEFQDFLKSCRGFCHLLEIDDSNDPTDLLQLQRLLLELYSNALDFPTIDLELNVDFKKTLARGELEIIRNRASALLGEHQYYWTIFDPTENIYGNEAPVMGDLLDDIMDIYRDIKRQLIIYDLNTAESIENAVWGMKFDFWCHWSNHAIDALRTIHYVLEKREKLKWISRP